MAPERKTIAIEYILVAANGADFGYELETTPDCTVGDVLKACAYGFDDPSALYGQDKIDFQWQVSESPEGPFETVGTGETFTVGQYGGMYLKVVAKAKAGTPGKEQCESPVGRIAGNGKVELAYVEVLNGSTARIVGETLQAQAYRSVGGQYVPVAEDVTYVWRASSVSPRSTEFQESDWRTIEGAEGASFTVPESLTGCWVSVTACAGDNTVASEDRESAGPFRIPGTYDILLAYMTKSPDDGTFVFESGQTLGVEAFERTAWNTKGDLIDQANLSATWYIADSFEGPFEPLDDENAHALSFTIPETYVGKHLKCVLNAGFTDYETTAMRNPIAQGETLGPVDPPTPPEPDEPASEEDGVITVSARIAGVTPHKQGQAFQAIDWVPLTETVLAAKDAPSAWEVFAALLDAGGYTYNLNGGCPYSVTSPDRAQTLAMSASAPWSYWSFVVNGQYASSLPSGYRVQDGDLIELVYVDATGVQAQPDIPLRPDAPVADWQPSWAGFGQNGALVQGEAADSLESAWTCSFAQGLDSSWSEPVAAGGFVFLCASGRLLKLDAETGAAVAEVPLAAAVSYGSRPVYAQGMIVVPLADGRIQALSALTLQTRWLTAALPACEVPAADGAPGYELAQQSLSTLFVTGGYLYAATASADWQRTYDGYLVCLNLANGALRWTTRNQESGYYWAGMASAGSYGIIAGDDGIAKCIGLGSADGKALSTLRLGAPCRSTVVAADGFAYIVTTDGMLHKVAVGDDGALTAAGSVRFAARSTSTPTLCGTTAYVGGALEDGSGVLSVIDVSAMELVRQVTSADGKPLVAEVKSRPLAVSDGNGTIVYFTCNGTEGNWPDYTSGGGVVAYRPGDAEATEVFAPDQGLSNYCMASVASDGKRLYYVNDSGTLFALLPGAGKAPGQPSQPDDQQQPGGTDRPNGSESGNGQGGSAAVAPPSDEDGTQGGGRPSSQKGGAANPASLPNALKAATGQQPAQTTSEEGGTSVGAAATAADAPEKEDSPTSPRSAGTTGAPGGDDSAGGSTVNDDVPPLAPSGGTTGRDAVSLPAVGFGLVALGRRMRSWGALAGLRRQEATGRGCVAEGAARPAPPTPHIPGRRRRKARRKPTAARRADRAVRGLRSLQPLPPCPWSSPAWGLRHWRTGAVQPLPRCSETATRRPKEGMAAPKETPLPTRRRHPQMPRRRMRQTTIPPWKRRTQNGTRQERKPTRKPLPPIRPIRRAIPALPEPKGARVFPRRMVLRPREAKASSPHPTNPTHPTRRPRGGLPPPSRQPPSLPNFPKRKPAARQPTPS